MSGDSSSSSSEEEEDLEQIMRDEAFEEWKERGWDPVDFSVEKMMEVWHEEEKDAIRKKHMRGESALSMKRDLIESERGKKSEFLKNVVGGIRSSLSQARKEAINFVGETLEVLEPKVVRNIRMKYLFDRMQRRERRKEKMKSDKIEAIRETQHHQLLLSKQYKEKTFKRIKRETPFVAKIERQRHDDEKQARNDREREYREMRRRLLTEQEERERKEREAKEEAERVRDHIRRAEEAKRLEKFAKEQRKEADRLSKSSVLKMKRKIDRDNKSWEQEKRRHERRLVRQQFHNPDTDGGPLGVYGIKIDDNDEEKDEEQKQPYMISGHRENRDESTVSLLEPTYQTQSEEIRIQIQNLESSHVRLGSKLKRMVNDRESLQDQSDVFHERIQIIDDTMDEIDRVDKILTKSLRGPPGRLPTLEETEARHKRKRKKHFLFRTQVELEQKREKISEKLEIQKRSRRKIQDQMHRLEIEIDKKKLELSQRESVSKSLPMIVGQSLQRSGLKIRNPVEHMIDINLASRLEIVRHRAVDALKIQNDVRVAESKKYVMKERIHEARSVFEDRKTRCEDLKRQIYDLSKKDSRQRIVEAIGAFFRSGTKLEKVHAALQGTKNWWQYRNERRSASSSGKMSVRPNDDHSVCLENSHKFGSLVGSILLPKYAHYIFTFVVTKCDQEAENQGDPTDNVVVMLGRTQGSMSQIGKFINRPIGDNNSHRKCAYYTINFEAATSMLCYNFTFITSLSENNSNKLIVRDVRYREILPDPMEWIMQPNGRLKGLSEYVRRIRDLETMPSNRSLRLSKELARVREIRGIYVDSHVFHESVQRFRKDELIELLKSAIQSAKDAENETLDSEKAEIARYVNMTPDKLNKEERRLRKVYLAKLRYLRRKRDQNKSTNTVNEKNASELVGRTVEIFVPGENRWVIAKIKSYQIVWRDMGTRRVVMHELVVDEARSTRSQKKKKKDDDEDDGVMWLDLSQAKCIVLNEDYNDGLLNLQEQLTFETDVEKVRRRQLENFNLEEKKRQSKEDNYLEQERLERLNQIYDGIIISVKDSIKSSEVLYREDKKCLKEIQKVAWMLKKEANMVHMRENLKETRRKEMRRRKVEYEYRTAVVIHNLPIGFWQEDPEIHSEAFQFATSGFLLTSPICISIHKATSIVGQRYLENSMYVEFSVKLNRKDDRLRKAQATRKKAVLTIKESLEETFGKTSFENGAKWTRAFYRRIRAKNSRSNIRHFGSFMKQDFHCTLGYPKDHMGFAKRPAENRIILPKMKPIKDMGGGQTFKMMYEDEEEKEEKEEDSAKKNEEQSTKKEEEDSSEKKEEQITKEDAQTKTKKKKLFSKSLMKKVMAKRENNESVILPHEEMTLVGKNRKSWAKYKKRMKMRPEGGIEKTPSPIANASAIATKILNSISSTPTSVSSQQTSEQKQETPSKIREGRAVDLFQNITFDEGLVSPASFTNTGRALSSFHEEYEGKQDTKSSSSSPPATNKPSLTTLSIPTVTLEEPQEQQGEEQLSPMSRFRKSANAASPIARKIITKISTKSQRLFQYVRGGPKSLSPASVREDPKKRRERLLIVLQDTSRTKKDRIDEIIDSELEESLELWEFPKLDTELKIEDTEAFARAHQIYKIKYLRRERKMITNRFVAKLSNNDNVTRENMKILSQKREERKIAFHKWQVENEQSRRKIYFEKVLEERRRDPRLQIPGIKKITKPRGCNHRWIQFWGTMYDKGYKCKSCGKEMSLSHEDPHQLSGQGAEASWPPIRTRDELEKRNLDIFKEDYAVLATESTFYDYKDGKNVYEISQRHHLKDIHEDTDTPRMRRIKALHRSHYREFCYFFFNIQKCTEKITNSRHELKIQGRRLRNLTSSFVSLCRVEKLLSEHCFRLGIAAKKLRDRENTLEEMKNKLSDLKIVRNDALTRYERARSLHNSCSETVRVCETRIEDMQFHMRFVVSSRKTHKEHALNLSTRAMALEQNLKPLREELERMRENMWRHTYSQRGFIVRTPYGRGVVNKSDNEWEDFEKSDRIRRSPHNDRWGHVMLTLRLLWHKGRGGHHGLQATVHMKVDDVMAYERSLAEAEMLRMEASEMETRRVLKSRERLRLLENKRMSREDNVAKEIREIRRIRSEERDAVRVAKEDARRKIESDLLTDDSKSEIRGLAYEYVYQVVSSRRDEVATWNKILGEPPKLYTKEEQEKMQRDEEEKLRKMYVTEAVENAEKQCRESLKKKRQVESENRAASEVMSQLVSEIVRSICSDVKISSIRARRREEHSSGIIISECDKMSTFQVYDAMRRLWEIRRRDALMLHASYGGRDRNQKLKSLLEERKEIIRKMKLNWVKRGLPPRDFSPEKLVKILKAEEAERKARIKRRNEEIAAMRNEESRCRDFYAKELSLCLRERRGMRREEILMKAYLDSQSGSSDSDGAFASRMEKRHHLRIQLANRLREDYERSLMESEDELATAIRAAEIAKALRERQMLEMAMLGQDVSDDDEDEDNFSEDDFDGTVFSEWSQPKRGTRWWRGKERKARSLRDRLREASKDITAFDMPDLVETVPEDVVMSYEFRVVYRSIRDAPNHHRLMRRRLNGVRKYRTGESLPATVAKPLKEAEEETMRLFRVAKRTQTLELQYMEAEMRVREARWRSDEANENAKLVESECMKCGAREVRLRHDLNSASKKLQDASEELETSKRELEKFEQDLSRLSEDTKSMTIECRHFETSAVHGVTQRWETDKAVQKLRHTHCDSMAKMICTRAERTVVQRLYENATSRVNKLREGIIVARNRKILMERSFVRSERMRMRRSDLGKLLFGKTQQSILKVALKQWHDVTTWRLNVKRGFELKHAVCLQDATLNRWREDMRKSHSDDRESSKVAIMPTFLHRYKTRVVQCVFCNQKYTEQANHENACAFHPGKYVLDCPVDCKYRGCGIARPHSCMAHYRWRWSCCDEREDMPFMKNGCSKRWHKRMGDPDLKEQLEQVTEKYRKRIERDSVIHEDHRKTLLELRVGDIHRSNKIARVLKAERKILEDYDTQTKNMTVYGLRAKKF